MTDLSVTLQTLNLQDRVTAAQIIQANLAEVGVTVEVVPLDSGPFWNLGQESKGDAWKDLQLWIMRYGGSPDPFDHFQWFVRDQVGVWNWERWSDDEFEDLYVRAASRRPTSKSATASTSAWGRSWKTPAPTCGSRTSRPSSCTGTG